MSHLITNIEQIRLYANINASTPWQKMQSYVDDARDRYILPWLGSELLTLVEEQAETIDETRPELTELLPIVRRALVPFIVYMAADESSINFGDSGHTVQRTDKLAPASDNKIKLYKESLEDRGWLGIEMMLRFIDTHLVWFPEWDASAQKGDFISSAEEYQEQGLVNINNSRVIFEKIRLIIAGINEKDIKPLLGNIYTGIKTNADTDVKIALVSLIQKYTANRSAEIITSVKSKEQQTFNSEQFKPIIRALYKDLLTTGNYYAEQADFYFGLLQHFINDNAEELGLSVSTYSLDFNTEEKKIFVGV